MSGATIFDMPTVPRLPTLLQNVADGTILIPRFQRTFVWDNDRRFLLLDSVLQGLPIGSLMVWRTTKHRLRCYENLAPFHLTLAPERERMGVQTYLLDGLQRLTTLFGALRVPSAELPEDEGDEDETRWPVYYDLQATERNFRLASRKLWWRLPDTWVPLSILLDPTAVWDFQQRLLAPNKARRSEESRELARKVEQIASRFKDYTVPVIPIHTDDLDLATESFQRVNSGGVRLDERHMLVALTFARTWDVSAGLERVAQRLEGMGWAGLHEAVLLDALKSYFDLEPQKRAVRELGASLEKEPGVFELLTEAAERAVRFLVERCGVLGPQALPYSYQLVALIDLSMRGKDLDARRDELVQWVEATTYSGHFASMNSTQLRRALSHARSLVSGAFETATVLPDDLDRRVGPLTRFNYNAARSRAFVWTLARQEPLDAEARPVHGARAVGLHGNGALDGILPGVAATLPANRIVVGDADVRALRRVLLDPSHRFHERVCRSHCVPPEAAAALAAGRHDDFFRLRAQHIWALERERIVGCGLEPIDPIWS